MSSRPAVLDLPVGHLRVLEFLLKRVPPRANVWVLTGSASLRMQGVDVAVHDLDIQADEKTVHLFEKELMEFMLSPVQPWDSTGMRSLDGKAEIDGIEIELMANIAHRLQDGSWGCHTDFSRLIWLETHGLQVPVLSLEDEYEDYLAMGRTEKAALICQALQKAVK